MNLVSAISILSNCGATWAPVVQHPRAWAPPLQSPSLSLSHCMGALLAGRSPAPRQGRPLALSVRAFLSCLGTVDRDHPGGPWLLRVHFVFG